VVRLAPCPVLTLRTQHRPECSADSCATCDSHITPELYQLMAANESSVAGAAAIADGGGRAVRAEPPARAADNVPDVAGRAHAEVVVTRIGNRGSEVLPEACNDAVRPDTEGRADRAADAPVPAAPEPHAAESVANAGRRNWLVPVLLCALVLGQGAALLRDNSQQQIIAGLQQRVERQAQAVPDMRAQLRSELREGREAASRQVEFLMNIMLNQLREEQQAYRVNSAPEAPDAGTPAAEGSSRRPGDG